MPALIAGLALAVWAAPGDARPTCQGRAANPAVTVDVAFPDPVLITNVQQRRLSERTALSHQVLMGKTEISKSARHEVKIRYRDSDSTDGVCYTIEAINVTLSADDLKVYIAREYRNGTCQYRVTLNHERRHVQIEYDAMRRQSKRLTRAFAKRQFRGGRWAKDAAAAMQLANGMVAEAVTAATDAAGAETARGHGRLDSPANYERESKKCRRANRG